MKARIWGMLGEDRDKDSEIGRRRLGEKNSWKRQDTHKRRKLYVCIMYIDIDSQAELQYIYSVVVS